MDPGSILQLVGASTTALQDCLKAYKFIHTAQHFGDDEQLLRIKFFVEEDRLKCWAGKAGLPNAPLGRLNWRTVKTLLGEQEHQIKHARGMRDKYARVSLEEAIDSEAPPGLPVIPPPSGVLDGVARWSRKRSMSNPTGRRSSELLKRMQWAAVGKDSMTTVIGHISSLNDSLYRMLDLASREDVHDSLQALLRDAVSRCTSASEMAELQKALRPVVSNDTAALGAAMHVRGMFLRLESESPQAPAGSQGDLQVKLKDERHLITARGSPRRGLELCQYRGLPVIVEWRHVGEGGEAMWAQLQGPMHELALLLGHVQDRAFHTLACTGLFEIPARRLYGLAFTLPACATSPSPSPSLIPVALHTLLRSVSRAPLADRIRAAQEVTEAVLQLHTAGWLHKGLCSDTLVFFRAGGDTAAAAENPLQAGPYLFGYQDSRPAAQAALTQMPAKASEWDLYRHPDARGANRRRFRRGFDLYSLACLLVELAVWKPLKELLAGVTPSGSNGTTAAAATTSDSKGLTAPTATHGSAVPLPSLYDIWETPGFDVGILHHVGQGYLDAIKQCLRSAASRSHDDASLQDQNEVLRNLRRLEDI
ncbi:hypothetical protein LTR53_004256 [Teratosphaeriaceae sp. CCFEE 6253]|nr:hypothetical protein LTR53_004256 [Teratosphaeriaceae sp. CCFEE 6253]